MTVPSAGRDAEDASSLQRQGWELEALVASAHVCSTNLACISL